MQRIRYSRYFKTFFILFDIALISTVFVYFFLRNYNPLFTKENIEQNILSYILLISYWVLLSSRTKLYSIARNITYTIYLERLATHIIIFIFGVILLAKVSNNLFLKQDQFLIAVSLFFLLLLIKSTFFFTLKHIRIKELNNRNIMFLSADSSSEVLKTIFEDRKDYGFKICAYQQEDPFNSENLVAFWRLNGIHTMYISDESDKNEEQEIEIHKLAELHNIRISIIPSISKNNFFQYELGYINTQPILVRSKFPLNYLTNIVLKRAFDLAFSAFILLFICSWMFPIIAIIIKLNGKGPVFFVQKRYKLHSQVFNCIKFRTMRADAENISKTNVGNDQRISKIGQFLRKTSLDELPQFLNVLKGDMSVVGPRPHMLLIDDFYKLKIGRYAIRSLVKPGITGLAQVNGLRGNEGNMDIKMQKRILADAFYVKNWTVILDLIIILKTVFLVIGGDKNAN